MKCRRNCFIFPGRVLLSGFFLLLFVVPSLHASDETIAPDSYVYPALRRFEAMGLVSLSPDIPYARSEIEGYVVTIGERIVACRRKLGSYDRRMLERLEEEFVGKGTDIEHREDRPVLLYYQDDSKLSFDAIVVGAFLKKADEDKGEMDGLFVPEVIFSVPHRFTVQSDYRVVLAPERGLNRRNRKPSPRVKSFRGMTSEYERANLSFEGRSWRVEVGRDYINWGNDFEEGLLVSRSAGSLDRFSCRFEIGRLRVESFQAVLDCTIPRRLAGHRAVVRFPRDIFLGIGETVLYARRGLDFVYLLPFSSYYSNQFNERGDDNILWSFDWKVPLKNFGVIYGEFLIDDLQYEREEPAPDRIGFNAGFDVMLPFWKRGVEISGSYTYLNIFTYAHKDSLLTTYVTGNGDRRSNSIVGSPLGPDADRWIFKAKVPVCARMMLVGKYVLTRRGEGNDLREWDRVSDPHPTFPSGAVTTERTYSILTTLDLRRNSFIYGEIGLRRISGGPEGTVESESFGSVGLRLDL